MTSTAKIWVLVLLAAVLVSSLFGAVAFADEESATVSVANLDETDALADLMTSEDFDVNSYSFKEGEHPKLISFVEYCYSPIANYNSLYRLYIYMSNEGKDWLADEGHSITIATAYSNGKPTEYESFDLELISVSENLADKETYNMFLKFRVVDHISAYDGLTIQERVSSSSARQYDVASIQLVNLNGVDVVSDNRVHDYTIGCSYTYTGFATGMGLTTAEPLSCTVENLETISLELNSTYYRTETSDKGKGYSCDINAVYFAVPSDYFADESELKRIKAEWYEFVTKDIVVTSNSDFYNEAKNYIGKIRNDCSYGTYGLAENYEYRYINGLVSSIKYYSSWSWNMISSTSNNISVDTLYYIFSAANISNYNSGLPLLQQGGISAETLENYIFNYEADDSNSITIGGRKINKNLFESTISSSRLVDSKYGKVQCGFDGKSVYEFDVDVDFLSFQTWDWTSANFWDNVQMMGGGLSGFWNALWNNYPETEESASDILCIQTVLKSDLSLSQSEFCSKYYINSEDYSDFIDYCENQIKADNEVVLFRYAVTDYYSQYLTIVENGLYGGESTNQAYRAWGSVFLDFDIIQLTFHNDEGYRTIPVVADPINIFPDVTPPIVLETNTLDEALIRVLTLLFTAALIIAVAWIVIKFLKFTFKR